jgi:hypothetical protein
MRENGRDNVDSKTTYGVMLVKGMLGGIIHKMLRSSPQSL